MASSDHVGHLIDRAVVDATEAWLLRDRVGQLFEATVVQSENSSATVLVDDPVIRAKCSGAQLPEGERIEVRLVEADVEARTVRFESVPQARK
jgi:exoribonuclease R